MDTNKRNPPRTYCQELHRQHRHNRARFFPSIVTKLNHAGQPSGCRVITYLSWKIIYIVQCPSGNSVRIMFSLRISWKPADGLWVSLVPAILVRRVQDFFAFLLLSSNISTSISVPDSSSGRSSFWQSKKWSQN
ncbi:MAG: hypothetical protein Ct9H300mP28_12530 [Pseudomonadota bacterium]|nr:MAG: hypothetical protein Ct9H300mP28_12530 [Pseudomonadota bacterium]